MVDEDDIGVTEIEAGTLDHQCIIDVMEAYRQAYVKLYVHYLIDKGEGPQNKSDAITLLFSLVISSLSGLLQEINDTTDLPTKLRLFAAEILVFADNTEEFEERRRASAH